VSTQIDSTHKVQFSFTKQALDDLDRLKEDLEAPSRAEAIRYALRWLQWTVDETKRGNKICLETSEGIREVMIPFIPNSTAKRKVKGG